MSKLTTAKIEDVICTDDQERETVEEKETKEAAREERMTK